MKWNWMKLSLTALFALVAAVGCDRGEGRNDVVGPDGPSFSTSIAQDYKAMQEGTAIQYAGKASKVIGPEGGYLYLDLHYLYVPKYAVSKPTLFSMEMIGEGKIGSKMNATTVGSSTKNDAGSRGFRVPVHLFFSYARATNAPADPSVLKIGEILRNGSVATVPTTIYREYKVAGGQLKHFSDYALIWP